MNPFQFDPSKMDPKVLMEMSQLIQQLPPQKLAQMQSLMHNMMAGFDVRKEMEELEKSLPPEFRQKLLSIMGSAGPDAFGGAGNLGGMPGGFGAPSMGAGATSQSRASETVIETTSESVESDMDVHQARLTILQAVADHRMTPEQAEKMLFS